MLFTETKKAPFGAVKKKINGEQTTFTKGLTKDCPVEMNKKRIINQQLNLKLRMAWTPFITHPNSKTKFTAF